MSPMITAKEVISMRSRLMAMSRLLAYSASRWHKSGCNETAAHRTTQNAAGGSRCSRWSSATMKLMKTLDFLLLAALSVAPNVAAQDASTGPYDFVLAKL